MYNSINTAYFLHIQFNYRCIELIYHSYYGSNYYVINKKIFLLALEISKKNEKQFSLHSKCIKKIFCIKLFVIFSLTKKRTVCLMKHNYSTVLLPVELSQ